MYVVKILEKIVTIIMSTMALSKVTIQMNGKGDGFITPTRGLR